MKKALTILMTIGVLVLSGCAAQTAGVRGEDLVGTWKEVATPHVMQFREDGTFQWATNVGELAGDDPDFFGQFKFEGMLLTLVTSDESHLCAGDIGLYEMELTEEGELKLTLSEDPCDDRARFMQRSTWLPITP